MSDAWAQQAAQRSLSDCNTGAHEGQTDVPVGADDWGDNAKALARWVEDKLVNRTDVFGAYLPFSARQPGGSNNFTAPNEERRFDGALTPGRIIQHFEGYAVEHLIGLHAISRDNTSRFLVIDFDQHGDDPNIADANMHAATGWCDKLRSLGFSPLLLDSNGKGGLHLLVVFDRPIASSRVFSFGQWLIADHQQRGLRQVPETFPKQPDVNVDRPYGNWWRLPGRHHTRVHWTRVWDGCGWLDGQPAIDLILAIKGDSEQHIPEFPSGPLIVPAGQQPHGQQIAGTSRTTGRVESWLEILKGCEPGQRHESLLKLAGHLLGRGVDPEVVEEMCVVWNEARNNPPKPEGSIRQTVRDLVARDRRKAPSLPNGRRRGSVTGTKIATLRIE